MPSLTTATAAANPMTAPTNTRSARYVQVLLAAAGERIAAVQFQPWRRGMTIPDFIAALEQDQAAAAAARQPHWAAAWALLIAALAPTPARPFAPAAAERQLAWPAGARRCQILQQLLRVPFGATISYGELARRVSPPSGPRAVGQTMNKNPFPLIVPCHRVIQTGGGLGGFGGGLDWKRALLAWEAAAGVS